VLKNIFLTVAMLGAGTFLSAGENSRQVSDATEVFIGVELGAAMVQGDTPLEINHDGSGASIGLRIGAQNTEWRTMAIVDLYDSDDDDQRYTRGFLQVDYYVMASRFATTAFRPYMGINGGYLKYESTGIDESGVSYGGQVGFTAAVSENIDFDVAFRYSITNPDEIDHIGNVVFGVNYLY